MIARAEEELSAEVNCPFLIWAQRDGRIPIKAKVGLVRARQRLDVAGFAGALAETRDPAALIFGVGIVGVGRIRECPEAVADSNVSPGAVRDYVDTCRGYNSC